MTTQNITCPVWQEQGNIDFNAYEAKTDTTSNQSLDSFVGDLESRLQGEKQMVVVNGGHYIPNLEYPQAIGKNALQTWETACQIANRLSNRGIDARVSLMINDLPLSPEQRASLSYEMPEQLTRIAESYGVQIMNTQSDKSRPYSEKRCSNRFQQMERNKKILTYPIEMNTHCVNAIIFYLRDIAKQGATYSVMITPKCANKNVIRSLQLYTQYEGGVGNSVYFETPNCFQ